MAATLPILDRVLGFVGGTEQSTRRTGVARTRRTHGRVAVGVVDQHANDGGPAQPGGMTLYRTKRGWRH